MPQTVYHYMYMTATASSAKDLDEIVSWLLKDAWQPWGSPYTAPIQAGSPAQCLCQAMVKTCSAKTLAT